MRSTSTDQFVFVVEADAEPVGESGLLNVKGTSDADC